MSIRRKTLIRAAAMLRDSNRKYRWNNALYCNMAFVLAATADGYPATRDVVKAMGGDPAMIWSLNLNHPICLYIKKVACLSDADIENIEYLADRKIIGKLAKRGVLPAAMFNRNRRYVAAYLEAMAEMRPRVKKNVANNIQESEWIEHSV